VVSDRLTRNSATHTTPWLSPRRRCGHHDEVARRGMITAVRLAMLVAGGVMAVESVAIGRRSPGFSVAGRSAWAATLEFAAGWSLIVVACVCVANPARRTFAAVLFAASLSWFAVEWNNPEVGSSMLFTAGLALSTVCPVLVVHAVLRDFTPKLRPTEALILAASYVSTLLISGLLPAMLFDPAAQGCSECPADLLAVHSDPTLLDNLTRAGTYAGVVWTGTLIVALAVRVARASAARRGIVAAVSVPAAAYVAAVGFDYWHSMKRGFLSNDTVDHRLLLIESVALIALALGAGWVVVRRRLTRAAVARLVVDAGSTPPAGGLARALGDALGDRTLRIFYPLSDGRLADSSGEPPNPLPEQAVTRLVRGEDTAALLAHRPGLLDVDGVAEEITRTARLALDNERLQAEARSRLVDLRASRARVVESADAERRRLERDLHDGAQQKLVSLALGLRLAMLKLDPDDSACAARMEQAQSQVSAALAELRAVARGLYPRELADEGLAAGLETLAESSAIPVVLRSLPDARYPQPVESAAYFTVAFCIQSAATAEQVGVAVTNRDGRLHIDVETETPPADLTRLEDRVGALDGSVTVEPAPASGATIRVELPCGS
jgi:signal transduction histidine kinase